VSTHKPGILTKEPRISAKEANVLIKEACILTKETYILTKEPHKRGQYPDKRGLYSDKRALYSGKRAPRIRKRGLYERCDFVAWCLALLWNYCLSSFTFLWNCDLSEYWLLLVAWVRRRVENISRYGVALISRLLKIVGLFCKRALQNRLTIFCKRDLWF